MPTLSDAQIATVARGAGFTGSNVAVAVAVCLAESGGRTDAQHGNSNGTTDYGLWQINSVHADLLRTGTWSVPADNARMAFSVGGGTNWQPWSTHNNGAYLAYLGRGRAVANMGNVPVLTVAGKESNAPPYTQQELHPPFTAAQIKVMVAWMLVTIADPNINSNLKADQIIAMSKQPDGNALAANYSGLYQAWYFLHKNPMTVPGVDQFAALIKFISDPHNWQRVGFYAIGGGLLLLAAWKLSGTPLPGPVGKAVKMAGKVKVAA